LPLYLLCITYSTHILKQLVTAVPMLSLSTVRALIDVYGVLLVFKWEVAK